MIELTYSTLTKMTCKDFDQLTKIIKVIDEKINVFIPIIEVTFFGGDKNIILHSSKVREEDVVIVINTVNALYGIDNWVITVNNHTNEEDSSDELYEVREIGRDAVLNDQD